MKFLNHSIIFLLEIIISIVSIFLLIILFSNAMLMYSYSSTEDSSLNNYTDTVCTNGEYKDVLKNPIKNSDSFKANEDLGYIYFPTLDKKGLIVQGDIADTSHNAMNKGVAHDPTTVMPGEEGNTVFFGHRELFLKNLGDLKKGDPIIINIDGNSFIYEIVGSDIIYPDDLDTVFKENKNSNTLTLYTCYPLQPWQTYDQRLVVHAKEVSTYECDN